MNADPTITLRVRGFAASTLDGIEEMAASAMECGDDAAPALAVVAGAYHSGALRFPRSLAGIVSRGLCELANGEDAEAQECARRGMAQESRWARAAAEGLTTLQVAASRAAVRS